MKEARSGESGFSKYLRETLAKDREFRSSYLAQVEKLPEASGRRVLRRLRLLGIETRPRRGTSGI